MGTRQLTVYWLIRSQAQVPGDLDWLHADEKELFGRFRFAKKQRDWLLGRWTAKQALLGYPQRPIDGIQLCDLAILPESGGAPVAYLGGNRLDLCISLSHSSGMGLCAIGTDKLKVGCDLEKVEPRSPALLADFFTEQEQETVRGKGTVQAPMFSNLIWSAKESALKTLRTGLRMDPRNVQVDIQPSGNPSTWNEFIVHIPVRDVQLYGRWQARSGFVLTIVFDHPAPILKEMV